MIEAIISWSDICLYLILFATGNLKTGAVLYNYTEAIGESTPEPGVPDGLKVDIFGNIFATGKCVCMYV